ncbi:MAG: hypothetical protein HRU15_10910, partial [Planctomycetes bacterium]|nr:hypothetical protein [Planctomycetota bacterium]
SFIGACIANNSGGALLCGDLAFLHDVPALSSIAQIHKPAAILVMNNHGGRIFDLLPVSEVEDYHKVITAEQQYSIAAAANMFQLDYHCANSSETLHAAIETSQANNGCSIIEIQVPADSLRSQWKELKEFCT